MRIRSSHLLMALALTGGAGQALAYNCTGLATWTSGDIYVANNLVKSDNKAYQAKWWTQNNPPASNSGQWDVWRPLGDCTGNPPTDTTPPTVPGGLASTGQTSSSVSLTWTASTDAGSGVANYQVFRGAALVASPTATSYTDTGLSAGTNYSYTVRARDVAGNVSAATAALMVNTTNGACASAPATPTGLNSPSRTSTSVNLAWSASAAGPNCTVQYRILQAGQLAGQSSTTSTLIGGLTPETTYSYSVVAVNQAGASAPSAAISVRTDATQQTGAKRVLGYFAQWGIYGRNYLVKDIDAGGAGSRLTHINYAFGNVRNNICEVGLTVPSSESTGVGGDAFADYTKAFQAAQSVDGVADTWDKPLRGSWGQLKKLKAKYPNLKVLISLGGWTYSRGFSSAARPENRQAFVASCIDAYIRGNLPVSDGAGGPGAAAGVFDGIDIDWEYPAACGLSCGTGEDTANFTALLAEFRRQLDLVRPGLLLTLATGAGIDKIRVTQPDKFHPYVDFINVMTYDFHGAFESTTNFHSALYGSPSDPSTGDARSYNTDQAIQAYLARGVPPAKLSLGIGFYGRGWTNVPNINNGKYQSGTGAPGTYESGIEDYKVLKNLNYPSFVDSVTRAQWIYNGNTFWSYDTPAQIAEKMQYAKNKGLGGAFFWEFSGDDGNATLLKAISDGLK